ncbi:heme ABC transporter ATP-binding protein [Halopenitus persicus]|uniref:Cobalamin import ATP-binding protein BtuD n=1 Tax=Halopenitus persicus TaxID=1048396 RepID=A0A1H3IX87_9EURY|nr:heme ABC transporter ATP-binding protein [Halopenitus persicus]SDY31945.1 iron complex transport system ATP-binding protein [Halopenitus persicus]
MSRFHESRTEVEAEPDADTTADPDHADQPHLEATDVTVTIGDATVLEGVDLAVEAGSFLGVVGPNGAGKTTLLRALRGSLTPDRGHVRVAGEDLTTLSARATARRVASVPQDTVLSFDFTVEQVVEMGRTPHRSRFATPDAADREAVDDAMATTDTARFADRSVGTLSGGERQRVLLARALAQETPVLVLDEPTGSLDVNHAVETLELVRGLVEAGKTVVAAIHDLNLAARYCDELLLLADGRVRSVGTPETVLSQAALRDAFDARTFVTEQPGSTAPLVTALPETPGHGSAAGDDDSATSDDGSDPGMEHPPIHVVGTGRRAATVVSVLAAAGFDVSVGVVPAGDAAAERAREVDADPVCVPSFSGITGAAAATARERADAAAALVLVDADVADGNRPIVEAVAPDRRVVVGEPADGEPIAAAARIDHLDDVADAVRAVLAGETDGW